MSEEVMSELHAIIPAGGAGTRVWPLSRKGHPKFLHDLTGSGRTLLQQTVDRLQPLAQSLTIVTGAAHASAVADQVDLDPANILAEPSPRDSMAAIGLAAALLQQRHPDTDVIVGSFAADHVIAGDEAFAAAVASAVQAAKQDYIATIGITPTEPSTAFGYIESGAQVQGLQAPSPVHHAVTFTEKPAQEIAEQYLAGGNHVWNAGMFVARASVLLEHLAKDDAELASGIAQIAEAWDTPRGPEVLSQVWPTLTKTTIDYAIAEPAAAAGAVAVVPGTFGWDDVGGWTAIRDLVHRNGEDGILGDPQQALVLDAEGSVIVPGAGRKVVLLGIPNAVVVDTPDALLVTTTEHAQGVKDVVARLTSNREDDLL